MTQYAETIISIARALESIPYALSARFPQQLDEAAAALKAQAERISEWEERALSAADAHRQIVEELQAQLAAQSAEPVAWMRKTDITEWRDSLPEEDDWTPLYAGHPAPQRRLTDEEIDGIEFAIRSIDGYLNEGCDCEFGHTESCMRGTGIHIKRRDALKALLSSAIESASQQSAEDASLYQELLYAVIRNHPNETRHQTALRYIRQAENPRNQPQEAMQQAQGKE